MADAGGPRKKKAAPAAAAELRRPLSPEELRRRAEEHLDTLSVAAAPTPEELAAAVHELRVHQIELEMQNEELRGAQLALDEQRAKYFELFDLAPVGYLTIRDKGIVGDANLTAAHLLGVERQLLIGQPFSAFVLAADRDAYYLHLRSLQQTGEAQSCELRLQRLGGEPFWAHLESRGQGAGDAVPLRYQITVTDVHERVLADEALHAREERLASAVDGSGVGLWDWNPQTGEETFSERWAEILGYTLAELAPTSIETWRGLSHPDDLQRDDELLEEHFSGRADIYSCETRMRHKDGHWVWVLDRGKVSEWDADGRPLRMIGTQLDISARKLAEEALRESEERHKEMISGISDVIAIMSADGTLRYKSPNIERHFGWLPEDLVGTSGWETVHPDDLERMQAAFLALLDEDDAVATVEYRYKCKDGGYKMIELTATNRVHSPLINGVLMNYHDITARKQAEDEVRQRNQELDHLNGELAAEAAVLAAANATITRIAATDDLTGLANRRHFYEALAKAISLARRHGYPVVLVSFDLDGLKRVNDSAGHEAGDEVLTGFAALLAALCRAEDLPGRLGGDEFSVLLPGIDQSGARGLAERVVVAVRSCAVLERRAVTVSAGVAQWLPDELPDDLQRRADEALYAAKRGGGDAVAGGG